MKESMDSNLYYGIFNCMDGIGIISWSDHLKFIHLILLYLSSGNSTKSMHFKNILKPFKLVKSRKIKE